MATTACTRAQTRTCVLVTAYFRGYWLGSELDARPHTRALPSFELLGFFFRTSTTDILFRSVLPLADSECRSRHGIFQPLATTDHAAEQVSWPAPSLVYGLVVSSRSWVLVDFGSIHSPPKNDVLPMLHSIGSVHTCPTTSSLHHPTQADEIEALESIFPDEMESECYARFEPHVHI